MKTTYYIMVLIYLSFLSCVSIPSDEWGITKEGNVASLKAGILERKIELSGNAAATSSLFVDGKDIISDQAAEFSVTLWKASPNEEPQGIDYSTEAGIEQQNAEKNLTDALKIKKRNNQIQQNIGWVDSVSVSGSQPGAVFDSVSYSIDFPEAGRKTFTLSFLTSEKSAWKGISAEITYEIYEGFPVIRKWVRFSNKSDQWMKIGNLVIDEVEVKDPYTSISLMTPAVRGIDPCIIAFSDSSASMGIISVSEVPSKLRNISEKGISGYNPDFFEWVLGPSESFVSEPVFIYAFSGETYPTVSSVSTALDRCVETGFKTFLSEKVLRPANSNMEIVPLFCTWTNYNSAINDKDMRIAADVASRIGFKCFQLDAGWSDTGADGGWAVSSIHPHPDKFPDMKGLSDYIRSKNMRTGLWYSVFISEQKAVMPNNEPVLFSLPLIRRDGGLGMSFCYEKSRENYIDNIVSLGENFNASYFKQDLSNICYGDLARGHENRTLKESYLRGLRGLFATQDEIHRRSPATWLQVSHEIYWETPGPAADVAILKHVDSYHSSPNEYWGAGNRKEPVKPDWKYNVDSLKQKLVQGAFRARSFLYAQRGLPINRIEISAAVTTNFKGSLTPEILDRQICSWLLGAPLCYSGDLGSLSGENIEQYRTRFATLERLQKEYGIYSCFQFSGVPSPTDEDWHWWGKLNKEGCGIVVVLRGREGEDNLKINIPWLLSGKKYCLKGLLSGTNFGTYTGKQLQGGELMLSLKPYGQEIIECSIK